MLVPVCLIYTLETANVPSTSTTQESVLPTPVPSAVSVRAPVSVAPASVPASVPVASHRSVTEHRNLFNYAPARTKSNKGRRGKKHKVATYSLKFMCMGKCNDEKPPTTVRERTVLSNAGLGDAVLSFNLDGDSAHFHDILIQKFPKLATCGYELFLYHRGGEESSLCPFNPPYAPRKLKKVAGQCKIYIRPLQKDILADNEELEEDIPIVHVDHVSHIFKYKNLFFAHEIFLL